MDCVNYRLEMFPYLKHELNLKKTKRLLEHVECCPECKEEMKIQFLVMEGMKRREFGGSYNLEEEFEQSIKEALRECRTLSKVKRMVLGFFYGGSLMVLAFLIKGIMI